MHRHIYDLLPSEEKIIVRLSGVMIAEPIVYDTDQEDGWAEGIEYLREMRRRDK